MSKQLPLGILSNEYDPAVLRKGCLISAFTYPVWRLLAPSHATDPWAAWWLIGGCFLLVAALPSVSSFVRDHLQAFFYGCGWLVATQFFVLAYVNDMHPYYSMGSVVAVVVFAGAIRATRPLVAYGGLNRAEPASASRPNTVPA